MNTPPRPNPKEKVELPRRRPDEIENPGDPGPPIVVPPDEEPRTDPRTGEPAPPAI